jgi:hypothetical protein
MAVEKVAEKVAVAAEKIAAAKTGASTVALAATLKAMGDGYRADPEKAVRSQSFIKELHGYLANEVDARLTTWAKGRGITVQKEATIIGSAKAKDVDVAVIDPTNGPLMLVNVRSQMSSVAKNVPNYYEMLLGEVTSLQERFPISTHGYVYLHPLNPIKAGAEEEALDHSKYARMYAAMTGRPGRDYKNLRGVVDEFAYMVVDFNAQPAKLHDELVQKAVPDMDMKIETFVDRMIATFKKRLVFWDVFS